MPDVAEILEMKGLIDDTEIRNTEDEEIIYGVCERLDLENRRMKRLIPRNRFSKNMVCSGEHWRCGVWRVCVGTIRKGTS